METITVIIPAFQEEMQIEQCISSVIRWCNEVVVVWMGTDKTGEVARKLGATVYTRNTSSQPNFKKVQENINWAVEQVKTDWILRIDADEVVTEKLKNEIQNVLSKNIQSPVAYGIPRSQYFWGGFLKGGDWAYDRLVRFFKKGYAFYDESVLVHEQLSVKGAIGYLSSPLLHYSHPTLQNAVEKFNIYTSLEAKDIHDSKVVAFFKMCLLPPYIFLRWMIWHHGWKDGLRGVVAGLFRGWYDFSLYAKYLGLIKK